jgi:phage terminase large subunit GpA-like protein
MIRAAAVDSGGHFTNSVYAYCKKNQGRRIFAIKGVGGDGKPIAGRPSKNNTVKCPLFPIGVDTVKDLIFARLRIKEAGSGYVHFNDILQDEYFRQLTAEKAVTRFHRGFKKRVFEKVRPRNEALDCMVYSIAAYSILGVNVNALADKMTGQEQPQKQESEPERKQEAFMPQYPRKGNFANSWR